MTRPTFHTHGYFYEKRRSGYSWNFTVSSLVSPPKLDIALLYITDKNIVLFAVIDFTPTSECLALLDLPLPRWARSLTAIKRTCPTVMILIELWWLDNFMCPNVWHRDGLRTDSSQHQLPVKKIIGKQSGPLISQATRDFLDSGQAAFDNEDWLASQESSSQNQSFFVSNRTKRDAALQKASQKHSSESQAVNSDSGKHNSYCGDPDVASTERTSLFNQTRRDHKSRLRTGPCAKWCQSTNRCHDVRDNQEVSKCKTPGSAFVAAGRSVNTPSHIPGYPSPFPDHILACFLCSYIPKRTHHNQMVSWQSISVLECR